MKSSHKVKKFGFALAIISSFFLVSACSANTAKSGIQESAPTQEATQINDSNCIKATEELLDNIAFLAQDGTGLVPVSGYYIKSPDFVSVYFVAMEFSATGIENQIGVWASNKTDGSNAIYSVDGFAKEFTDWFHSDETDANISPYDPSINRVRDCFN